MLGYEHPHIYTEEWTLEAIGRFVAASGEIRFEAEIRPQLYEWMERVLVEQALSNWVQAHREGTLKGARGKPQVSAEQMENSRIDGDELLFIEG